MENFFNSIKTKDFFFVCFERVAYEAWVNTHELFYIYK